MSTEKPFGKYLSTTFPFLYLRVLENFALRIKWKTIHLYISSTGIKGLSAVRRTIAFLGYVFVAHWILWNKLGSEPLK